MGTTQSSNLGESPGQNSEKALCHPKSVWSLACWPHYWAEGGGGGSNNNSNSSGSILTGSSDGKARIWDCSMMNVAKVLEGHKDVISAVDWSHDGRYIVTASWDKTARVWISRTGFCIRTISHEDRLSSASFSPSKNHHLLATASINGTVHILKHHQNHNSDVQTWNHIATLKDIPTSTAIHALAWAPPHIHQNNNTENDPNYHTLVTGHSNGLLPLWNISTLSNKKPKCLAHFQGHSQPILSIAWSTSNSHPNQQQQQQQKQDSFIAAGCLDGTVRVWNVSTRQCLSLLTPPPPPPPANHVPNGAISKTTKSISSLAWYSLDHRYLLFTASHDATLCIWNFQTASCLKTISYSSSSAQNNNKNNNAHGLDCIHSIACCNIPNNSNHLAIVLGGGNISMQQQKKQMNACIQTFFIPSLIKADAAADLSIAIPAISPNTKIPQSRCFKRLEDDTTTTTILFDDALTRLLTLRENPPNRPDLERAAPDDDDLRTMRHRIYTLYPTIQQRTSTANIISNNQLTKDQVLAIIAYTMEYPYKLYQWLNAWLMSERRDDKVQYHIGPYFILLYRALEKLPQYTHCRASRGVRVRNIPSLRQFFENYKEQSRNGRQLSLWGISSFSTEDDVSTYFAGGGSGPNNNHEDEDAIIYTCANMTCVSIQEFSELPDEKEVMPMPPSTFKITNSFMHGRTLIVGMEQESHYDIAYVVPKR